MASGETQLPRAYLLFDLPHLEGNKLSRLCLPGRKQLLCSIGSCAAMKTFG